MNVLGHAFVAERVRPDDDAHTFGAVLPDLASMAGVRIDRVDAGGPAFADGVRCHHAADAAFHSQPAFAAGAAAMRRELLDAGLATGPARAVAHVGYELLLDATLAGGDADDAFHRAFGALAAADSTLDALRPVGHDRWRAFVVRMAAVDRGPVAAGDRLVIAERLVTVLRHRPRLALAPGDAPVVADVLDRHGPEVRRSAPAILAAVVGAVSSTSPTSRPAPSPSA